MIILNLIMFRIKLLIFEIVNCEVILESKFKLNVDVFYFICLIFEGLMGFLILLFVKQDYVKIVKYYNSNKILEQLIFLRLKYE